MTTERYVGLVIVAAAGGLIIGTVGNSLGVPTWAILVMAAGFALVLIKLAEEHEQR